MDVKPETKAAFDRLFKYPRPYYANIEVTTSLRDALKRRVRG